MTEVLIFGTGVVVGVVYHAKLQPIVARAWAWFLKRISTPID